MINDPQAHTPASQQSRSKAKSNKSSHNKVSGSIESPFPARASKANPLDDVDMDLWLLAWNVQSHHSLPSPALPPEQSSDLLTPLPSTRVVCLQGYTFRGVSESTIDVS